MIIGHKKQINFLESILATEKIPQSYLFIGPENIGKLTVAKSFANVLSAKDNQKIKLRIEEGVFENNNSDIEVLTPKIIEKKGIRKTENIKVNKIREAQKNLTLFPIGRYRILIINDAERLNIASQNTLLKTLEEPASTTIVILITSQQGSILKTIQSRCQKINFNLVSFDEIRVGFKKKNAEALSEKVILFSMGRPGKAVELLIDKEKMTELELLAADLKELKNNSIFEKFELAEKYSKNLPQTIQRIEFWVWLLRIQAYRKLKSDNAAGPYYRIITKMLIALRKLKESKFNNRLILENLFLNL